MVEHVPSPYLPRWRSGWAACEPPQPAMNVENRLASWVQLWVQRWVQEAKHLKDRPMS
jgi:hypothetical protein